ncbi:hypothetical protein NDU88_001504 [Pleurodeles waltl]|uniref:Uncharacterized protein n=1 Tax=Pleurodeles waltl TaxID=8319 RepID=A0AAV7VBY1_PLEWA|nr:hypothetical protein NDU88_001504 [Pleurodeles waltl]
MGAVPLVYRYLRVPPTARLVRFRSASPGRRVEVGRYFGPGFPCRRKTREKEDGLPGRKEGGRKRNAQQGDAPGGQRRPKEQRGRGNQSEQRSRERP